MGQEHHWSDNEPYPPEMHVSTDKGKPKKKGKMTSGYAGLRPSAMPRWLAEDLLAAASRGEPVEKGQLRVARRRVRLKRI